MNYRGDYLVNSLVRFKFTTNSSGGARSAFSNPLEASDLLIFRDDGTTPRASVAGVTIISDFASKVGVHHGSIDLANDDDPGFFAAGHDYDVLLYPSEETVDSKEISAIVASFSIENRTARADIVRVAGVAGLASRFAQNLGVLLPGTVHSGATTLIVDVNGIAGYGDDVFNGRSLWFLSGANVGNANRIIDYTEVGGRGRFTLQTPGSPVVASEGDVVLVI